MPCGTVNDAGVGPASETAPMTCTVRCAVPVLLLGSVAVYVNVYVPITAVLTVPEVFTEMLPAQSSWADAPGSTYGCPPAVVLGPGLTVMFGATVSWTVTIATALVVEFASPLLTMTE